jgi:HK97 family phage portal protein
MTSFFFRQALMSGALLRGNAFAEIQRDNANRVKAIYPLPSDVVKIERGSRRGELYFDVTYTTGRERLKAADVLNIPCLSLDGVAGLTPIQQAKESIGLGLAAERMGSALFGNGAKPSGALVSDAPLNAQQVDGLKKLWQEFSGAGNAGKTPILYGGLKWVPFTINPDDAQFLETRQFQVADIARMFRVPGVLLGLDDKTSTYASAEQFFLSFVVHTLTPWMTAIEQEFNRKLFPGKTDIYCKLDPRGMMRGDAAGRAEFYNKLFNVGAVSPNDIRELEDMNPVDGGDIYLVPMNMNTLDNAGKTPEPNPPQQEDPAARLLDRVMKCERQIGAINSRLPKEQQ